ncbi:MAG: hypothetical protein OXR66_00625 [Candidatus Woesearchaeota archaeon]|nr:hypothetical protein [Candidatus Woesearchaeota archaeon]
MRLVRVPGYLLEKLNDARIQHVPAIEEDIPEGDPETWSVETHKRMGTPEQDAWPSQLSNWHHAVYGELYARIVLGNFEPPSGVGLRGTTTSLDAPVRIEGYEFGAEEQATYQIKPLQQVLADGTEGTSDVVRMSDRRMNDVVRWLAIGTVCFHQWGAPREVYPTILTYNFDMLAPLGLQQHRLPEEGRDTVIKKAYVFDKIID